jgi:hypothetical protein
MAGDSLASQHLLLKWKGVHETGATPDGPYSNLEEIQALRSKVSGHALHHQ